VAQLKYENVTDQVEEHSTKRPTCQGCTRGLDECDISLILGASTFFYALTYTIIGMGRNSGTVQWIMLAYTLWTHLRERRRDIPILIITES